MKNLMICLEEINFHLHRRQLSAPAPLPTEPPLKLGTGTETGQTGFLILGTATDSTGSQNLGTRTGTGTSKVSIVAACF